ncbi:MAG: DUF423 domain-containing protein [Acidiferrobacterales bacterium]|nr:DUF423 domain-containing protein [Acidiferrobacterales bacterium]
MSKNNHTSVAGGEDVGVKVPGGKFALVVGSTLCLFAVIFGAFGAHALAEVLESNQREDVYELANRYQFYHGLALLILGGVSQQLRHSMTLISYLMTVGVVIFSGSLYVLALTNVSVYGAITPIGGVFLLISWGLLVKRFLAT